MHKVIFLIVLCLSVLGCKLNSQIIHQPQPAANSFNEYLSLLNDKKVGLLVNHSSLVDQTHLLDTLLSYAINITTIFAPEHGFRGIKDAGEEINSSVDKSTGIPIVSLYGKNKKPSIDQLKGLDVVVFDIQDVGVRFYTYISTMHYMMEACAEANVKMIVLDRPNPNGDYFAGPILKKEFQSFVGMHPIPVVHGLTVGELAIMINQECWLEDGVKCDLLVIKCKNWDHNSVYKLPVHPSPNLPNYLSIRLYPSLCFFEATDVSVGRGTYFPFQVIGFPEMSAGDFSFTPQSIDGMAKNPKQKGVKCYGIDFRKMATLEKFTLKYFLSFYNQYGKMPSFKLNERWFNLLAGNNTLIKDIKQGLTFEEVELKWKDELETYDILRDKYLLYPKETN